MSEKSEAKFHAAADRYVSEKLQEELSQDDLHVYLAVDETSKKVVVHCFSTLAMDLLGAAHKSTIVDLDEFMVSVLEDLDRVQARAALKQIQASLDRAKVIQKEAVKEWDRENAMQQKAVKQWDRENAKKKRR